ncbi:MAG TPA: hypothetical protein H9681_01240 [Firmicutes bacterium]|nr:hypothetical protein [Bacillota bacterium]
MKKRAFSILLLIAILATNLISCGEEQDIVTNDDSDTTVSTDSSTETENRVSDDLPDGLDFGGEEVTFLYRAEVSSEFYADTANGDIVNDALYNSIRSVEERLNVDIVAALREGHYTSVRDEYMNHISSTIMAGDDAYDFVDLMIGNSPVMMQEGIFVDLLENKYIDVDKPYYLAKLVDTVAIDDKLYFISGDASLGYMKCAFCMYFNKRLVDEYQIEDLYTLVDEGKWTLDKLREISTIASQDVNNDGKYDYDDKLGFVVHDWNHPKGFWFSTDMFFYSKNDDGSFTYDFGDERDVDICNSLYQLIYNTPGSFFPGIGNAVVEQQAEYNQLASKFASGDILIMTAELDDAVAQLRDMKDSYGILPYPKYDEAQENYISGSRNTHNAFSMPITCGDQDMAGAVLEALSASNYNTVLPAYFEIALKTKYAHDDDSARMYDLIRETMILDFGYIYGNAIGGPEGIFYNSIKSENSLASQVASNKTRLQTALESYIEKYREMCG